MRRALISVSDKTGIVDFARALHARGVEILATGGTAAHLAQAGIATTDVAAYTGFPEMLDGRLKTLHPKIHGGILAIRGRADHMAALQQTGIGPIDCIVVNLYPFAATVARAAENQPHSGGEGGGPTTLPVEGNATTESGYPPKVGGRGSTRRREPEGTLATVIEQIDIGGPSLLRAAAKNYADVVALCDPADYASVVGELAETGTVAVATAFRLAQKVFTHTAQYDALIAHYLGRQLELPPYPERLVVAYEKVCGLRYGENPHQQAAWYRVVDEPPLIGAPLQGKELSYNNLLDTDAAIACVRAFPEASVVIVKHTSPCGIGISRNALAEAFARALAGDPVAAYGGIIGCNRPVDSATAAAIAQSFFEVVCAPAFSAEAKPIFAAKKNLRLVTYDPSIPVGYRVRSACGGRLVQDADEGREHPAAWRVVTRRKPSVAEDAALRFAWRAVKHVQSNAVVLTNAEQTIGIGAGQMSRVDAVILATLKTQSKPPVGTGPIVAASDAFFPFRDGVDALARAGVTAVIQPGGSLRDAEVVAAADEHRLAMVLTGIRHFRH